MAKIDPLSGFPEFLPAGRIVERSVIDALASTFELHGFANIETRVVEPLERLAKGGEIDKEIYLLNRLTLRGCCRARTTSGSLGGRSGCTSTSRCRWRGTWWRTRAA